MNEYCISSLKVMGRPRFLIVCSNNTFVPMFTPILLSEPNSSIGLSGVTIHLLSLLQVFLLLRLLFKPPPSIHHYLPNSSSLEAADSLLSSWEDMYASLHHNLLKVQQIMKHFVDTHYVLFCKLWATFSTTYHLRTRFFSIVQGDDR